MPNRITHRWDLPLALLTRIRHLAPFKMLVALYRRNSANVKTKVESYAANIGA
jgi:hypothetical protein